MKLKPQPIFYILLSYVLLQFCWWAYMLLNLNHEVLLLNGASENLSLELNKKTTMILGEGAVFLLLLGFGSYLTLKSFKKEVQLSNQQKNFLLSATHELKTPLASIKLMLETFQKRDLTKEQQLPLLQNSLTETNRLNSLIENMMLASQFDNNQFHLEKSSLNVSELSKNIATLFQGNYKKISTAIDDNIVIKSNKHAFESILYNLVDNALKYSNDSIRIELKQDANVATLKVIDNGDGIIDAEKKLVFQRFYRVGNELTRETKGTGLGLYIVKQLVDFHQATIKIENNLPKGTIFVIKF
jgi:two-component system phosphate regulon sensor histidine kinase PhoR